MDKVFNTVEQISNSNSHYLFAEQYYDELFFYFVYISSFVIAIFIVTWQMKLWYVIDWLYS